MNPAANSDANSDLPVQSSAARPGSPPVAAQFRTTHWSVVLASGGGDTEAADALNVLCSAYWYPVYAFIRRRGFGSDDAQDLAQAFFADLLSRGALQKADPERGRFRSFLLGSLKHFLGHERDRARAQKRGGQVQFVSMDWHQAETRYELQVPARSESPEKSFDREWALQVLERALLELQREYEGGGRENLYNHLKAALGGDSTGSYRELAERLGSTEAAMKVAVHRLRRRFRTLLREEIAHTVATTAEVDEEMRYLSAVLETA